ncbi:MAG: hypothetical protein N2Z79_05100, partial [Candidatus Omnitrophica bacterium]|nr:hypothetical protein [Candidatus Omnitrophota bacterium]
MEILNIKRLLFLLVMFFLFLGESFAQKISLDIKGMDILDVLKMLAQRANLNIVVGKNVSGRVTLFLKDVDVWDAFEIILLSNDLAYDKKGEIINVMTARDYEMLFGRKFADKKDILVMPLKYTKAVDLSRAVTQIKSDVGRVVIDENSNTLIVLDLPEKLKIMEEMIKNLDLPTQTRIFELNYAQVDKVLPKIQELITKNLGSIKIDERTNKLVIVDFPEKIKEIEKIIKAFDEKTPQVLIDAQIVEISPSDKFEMGVDWDYWLEKNFRLTSSLPASGVFNKISIGTATEGKNVTQKGDYKGIIDLLRTIGETKILSSPRIMALNNQEARILV